MKIISATVPLSSLNREDLTWLQEQLVRGSYLRPSDVDGVLGPRTRSAFNQFKDDAWLGYADMVGPSTIEALKRLSPKNPVSEQPQGFNQRPLPNAGKKEGRSTVLPAVGQIWEYEWISDGSFLTWGEVTKGLTRLPLATSEVTNIIALSRAFGNVRRRFGSPLGVTSGFRPRAINAAVGGASNSQHIYGRALDFYPLNGSFVKLLEILKAEPAFTGIGLGQRFGFLHGDTRIGDRVIFPY
jgi:peptidoglycan hydrolase-like protein with peptidoglycan-binding domain